MRARRRHTSLNALQFERLESECGVHFDDELRASLNETLHYWARLLSQASRRTSPVAEHHRGKREAKRKRRLGLVRELALHYAAAGGIARPNGYNREVGKVAGFSLFLQLIHEFMPSAALPKSIVTFIRDAEHLDFDENDPHFELSKGADAQRLAAARAKYMLEIVTRWRRAG